MSEYDPSFVEEEDPEEEEQEGQPRRQVRRFKKEAVMRAECEQYWREGKRLPKLHTRWIVPRFLHNDDFLKGSIPEHNRIVKELYDKTGQLIKAHRKLDQIQLVVVYLRQAYPALLEDERFQELERLADKDSAPRYDQP